MGVIHVDEYTEERRHIKEKVITKEMQMDITIKSKKAELERKERKDPDVVRQVDDIWYKLFDQTPFETRRMATGNNIQVLLSFRKTLVVRMLLKKKTYIHIKSDLKVLKLILLA